MPRFAILILSGLIVLLAALLVVAAILSPSLSVRDLLVETDDAIIITIPAGTDAAFDRGEDVSIIHGDL